MIQHSDFESCWAPPVTIKKLLGVAPCTLVRFFWVAWDVHGVCSQQQNEVWRRVHGTAINKIQHHYHLLTSAPNHPKMLTVPKLSFRLKIKSMLTAPLHLHSQTNLSTWQGGIYTTPSTVPVALKLLKRIFFLFINAKENEVAITSHAIPFRLLFLLRQESNCW